MKKVKINTILFTLLASSFLLPITSLADEITETDLTKTIETTHAGEGIGASEHATLQTDGNESPSTENTEAPYAVALEAALKRVNDWYQSGGVTQAEMTEMLNKVHAATSITELEALGFTDGSEVDLDLVAAQEAAYLRVKDWYEAGGVTYEEMTEMVNNLYATTSITELEALGFTDGSEVDLELVAAQEAAYQRVKDWYEAGGVTYEEMTEMLDKVYATTSIAELEALGFTDGSEVDLELVAAQEAAYERVKDWYEAGGVTYEEMTEMLDKVYATTSIAELEALGFTDGSEVDLELVAAQEAAYERVKDWYEAGGVTYEEMTEMLDKVYATTSIAELEALGFTDGSEVNLELVAAQEAAYERVKDWYEAGGVTYEEMTEMLDKVYATASIAELEALGFTDGSEVDLELVAAQEAAYERVKDWYEAGHGSFDEAQILVDQIYASTSLSQLEELGFTDGPTISPELVLAQDKSYTILVEAYHEKKVTHPELNDLVDRVYKTKTIAELKGIMVPFTSEETDTETPSEPDKPTEPETPGESDTPTEPETPGESDTPTEPETPGESDTPTEPETPGKSDTPTETETPGKSDTPTETETPGESDTPTEPETPGESDKPTKRKTPGESDTPTETRTSADSRKSSKEKIESNQETTALPQTNEVKNSSWLVGGLSTLVASFSLFRRNN